MSEPFKNRIHLIYDEFLARDAEVRGRVGDPVADKMGYGLIRLIPHVTLLAVARYVLFHDIPGFRGYMSEAANAQKRICQRFIAGDPISPGYIGCAEFRSVFYGLCGGNIDAALVVARELPKVTKGFVRETILLAFAVKSAMLDTGSEPIEEFRHYCQAKPKLSAYLGYGDALLAVSQRDPVALVCGLERCVEGHARLIIRGRELCGTHEECLSIWGIGIARMARYYGMEFRFDHPLIPADLTDA